MEIENLTNYTTLIYQQETQDLLFYNDIYIGNLSNINNINNNINNINNNTENFIIINNINNNNKYTTNDNINNSNSEQQNCTFIDIAENVAEFLTLYYTPLLVLTGSIGNILSVLVFFQTKLKKLSSSYYLAALGVSDTCFLFVSFIEWLNFLGVNLNHRDIFCQLFTYLSGICSFLSVWFVVAFTVERFIAVEYPLKRQTMCTVRRAKIVLCCLTILGILQSSPLVFLAEAKDKYNTTMCDVRDEYKHHTSIFNYVDTIVVFLIPFTTIVILNSKTGWTVWRVAGVRRSMTTHKRKPVLMVRESRKQQTIINPKCTHLNGHHSVKQSCPKTVRQRTTNSSQVKVTKMLLIVSSVFVLLNLPSYVMRLKAFLETEGTRDTRITIVIQYYCWIFFLTNFGINFVLYCVSGQNFRKAVIGMFRKASNQRQDGGTQVTVSEYIRSTGTGSNTSRRRIVTTTKTRSNSWHDLHELQSLTTTTIN